MTVKRVIRPANEIFVRMKESRVALMLIPNDYYFHFSAPLLGIPNLGHFSSFPNT